MRNANCWWAAAGWWLIGVSLSQGAEPAARAVKQDVPHAKVLEVGLAPQSGSFDPIARYEQRKMQGWTVLVNKRVLKDIKFAKAVLKELDSQIYLMSTRLPLRAVQKLRGVQIWLEMEDRLFDGSVYHRSVEWLRKNGYNPAKAKSVEIGNAANLLSWTKDQPYLLLHEFAHAFHDQVLGDDNPKILAAYHAAIESKLYDLVLRNTGRLEALFGLKVGA